MIQKSSAAMSVVSTLHFNIATSKKPSSFVSITKYFLLLFSFFPSLLAHAQVTQTFASSGTWQCPAGVTSITIESWGAGGAGGGVSIEGSKQAGAGGGGGAYSKATLVSVIPGIIYNVTIGNAGIPDEDGGKGGNGGNSYFNISTALAGGGKGGGANSAGSGGAGGTGTYNGGSGASGSTVSPGKSGGGGGAATSLANGTNAIGVNGGSSGGADGVSGSNDGNDAIDIGGGGSGAYKGGGNKTNIGGNGGNGQVKISYTNPPPTITALSANICVGGTIQIAGTNFNGITAANVKIGTTPVSSITSFTSTQIIAAVNVTASGKVSVTTPAGMATSIATFTVNAIPSVSAATTPTCVNGSSGTININAAGGSTPYLYSLNSGTYQAASLFSGLAAGNYSISVKSNAGCIASSSATVSRFANSTDNQSASASNSWIGHIYSGMNFENYIGHFTEPETFNESFGGDYNCFGVTSNASTSSIYTENFSVKFKMNSTKKGLYVVDLGSDDGSRLAVDNILLYNNWVDQSFSTRSKVLLNLTGASTLNYEFYENSGGNQVVFQNLTLILANSLTANTTQSLCRGNAGSAISGDAYGTLPAGITLSGTGYQWCYSLTPTGTRINISGATSATFIPNTNAAPFNAAGTYYVYRIAKLSSSNNTGAAPYVASNESNAAVITVNVPFSATISYVAAPFCNTLSTSQSVTLAGSSGGTFSSAPAGLSINASTGAVVPSHSADGNYTVTYSSAANGGCPAFATSVDILVGKPGQWTGIINNVWNNAGNWLCGQIPGSSTDVTLKESDVDNPPIISSVASIHNLIIQDGASLTVNGTAKIYGSITNNNGNLVVENGTIEMAGTSGQAIAGSLFKNHTLKNLIVSNTGTGLWVSSAANDTLKISGTLSFGNINSKLNTGDNITLLSDSTATASVDVVNPGNLITGKVIVERYIATGDHHAKGWQLLAAPASGQTIKESWMENGLQTTTPTGYGLWIPGTTNTAGGFDGYSVSPSMKIFSAYASAWVEAPNPSATQIHNNNGYIIFVRGDRSVFNTAGANSSPLPTKLRTKGTLLTGTQPSISVPAGKYQSVGNPYASRVEFSKLAKSNVDNVFYVWDPLLYGNYGYGGYQALSATNNYMPTAPGNISTANYQQGVSYPYIESGQAFLVHNSATSDGSVTFTESAKAGGSHLITGAVTLAKREFVRTYLYTSAGAVTDGNVVAFDNDFSNTLDGDDAIKISNTGENFGIKRNGKILAIEARSPVDDADTIFYNINNFAKQTYQLHFEPENMDESNLGAFLIDKYLKTVTPLNLAQNTSVNFTVNTDPASSAADRLMVVFKAFSTLPVTFTSVKAYQKNADISVEWSVDNQTGIQQYEIEKSVDGTHFVKAGTVAADKNVRENYKWLDLHAQRGYNYYRVRSLDADGKAKYTGIVKVYVGMVQPGITIFPNPISNGIINLQFNNQPAGLYSIRIFNKLGQVIASKTINHTEGNNAETINWDSNLSHDIYNLEITQPNGIKKHFTVLY